MGVYIIGLLPLAVAFIGICLVEMIIYANTPSPSERVCDNLLRAHLLDSEADCFLTEDYVTDFAGYFPEHEVDWTYVVQAMQGFNVVNEARINPTGCLEGNDCFYIDYRITNGLIFDATYEFVFVDNVLVERVPHD